MIKKKKPEQFIIRNCKFIGTEWNGNTVELLRSVVKGINDGIDSLARVTHILENVSVAQPPTAITINGAEGGLVKDVQIYNHHVAVHSTAVPTNKKK